MVAVIVNVKLMAKTRKHVIYFLLISSNILKAKNSRNYNAKFVVEVNQVLIAAQTIKKSISCKCTIELPSSYCRIFHDQL